MSAKSAKIGLKTGFFAIFSSLAHQFSLQLHTLIACNNVQLEVEVTSMRKNFWAQICVKYAKIQSQINFFAIFSSLMHQFSFKLQRMIASKNLGKTHTKNGSLNQAKMAQILTQDQVFCCFFKFRLLVFEEIAQDDSLDKTLVHCLDETLEKKYGSPNLGLKSRERFRHFLKVPSLGLPNIAQECSLRQFLTASRGKTSKNKSLGTKLGRK